MKAIIITRFGGPEVLEVEERVDPILKKGEILIEVKAAGVNRPDIFQRKGNYPAPATVSADIPGLEVAGIVMAVDEGVKDFTVGDRVMALVAGAGYATLVAVDAGSCIRIPDSLSFEVAACLPETLFTVWHNVFQRGALTSGERFLVHGGAGGIGSTAIQLAKLFGAEVITTVSSETKKAYVKGLGAAEVINYHHLDYELLLKSNPVDVILDSIGGDYFNKNISILKEEGRLVYINAMAGSKVELNILKLMQKRIHLTGSTLRNRDADFKRQLRDDIVQNVMPFIESNQYKVHIDASFPMSEASKAHELMESRDFMGKIVLLF